MVKAQEWLEENCPQKIRENITGLDTKIDELLSSEEEKLTGSLKLENFRSLSRFNCPNNKIAMLDLGEYSSLEELNCSSNQLTYLKLNKSLKKLVCSDNQLTSLETGKLGYSLKLLRCDSNKLTNLDLIENPNLVKLSCGWNKLNNLDVSKNTKLAEIDCRDNQIITLDLTQNTELTEVNCSRNQLINLLLPTKNNIENFACQSNLLSQLNWNTLNPQTLRFLAVNDNNLAHQNLEFLSSFSKLFGLYLGTDDKGRIQQGIYNRFYGSLKPLQNMNKLGYFKINNTDIDSGVEYLPESLKSILIDHPEPHREEAKVNQLFFSLESCRQEYFDEDLKYFYNLQEWRRNNTQLINKTKQKSVEQENERLKSENLINQIENKRAEAEQLTNLISQEKLHFKTRQELQNLIQTKQGEMRGLEQQLNSLQNQQQTAQIQQNYPFKK